MASSGKTVGTPGDLLTRQALNRATLDRQFLLRRAADGVLETIEHLVGMQSQVPNSPYVGLWTRLRDFQPGHLADLLTGRDVVRIALLRSTVHLVSAADCLTLRPVVQPVLDRGLFRHSTYGPGVDGLDHDALLAVGRDLLDAEPWTPAELRASLGERWPDRDADTLTTVLRNLLPLIQVPPRGVWGQGGQTRYVTAPSWLGCPLGTDTAPDDLVLRYLRAFGPATVRDVQTWSGLTRLREVLDRLRPRLRIFHGEDGAELFDLPDAPRPDLETPAPPRFLPEYDNLLAAYADRSRVTTDTNRKRLARPNGASPALLVNGQLAGSWRTTTKGGAATLQVDLFTTLSTPDSDAVAAEAHRLLDFLSPTTTTHDVQLHEPH